MNEDLPEGCCHKKFRRVFVPLAIEAIGATSDPWTLNLKEVLPTLQDIFNDVFPDLGVELVPNKAALEVVGASSMP